MYNVLWSLVITKMVMAKLKDLEKRDLLHSLIVILGLYFNYKTACLFCKNHNGLSRPSQVWCIIHIFTEMLIKYHNIKLCLFLYRARYLTIASD